MNAPPVARFDGPVACRIDAHGPLGLTLSGRDSGGAVHVSFVTHAPRDFPAELAAATVERVAPERYRISDARGERALEAARAFVHRDVRIAFERAVPPRRAPFVKRAFWRAVLAFAATAAGRRALGVRAG